MKEFININTEFTLSDQIAPLVLCSKRSQVGRNVTCTSNPESLIRQGPEMTPGVGRTSRHECRVVRHYVATFLPCDSIGR